MIPEFETYHGVVLRDIIVCCDDVRVKCFDLHGRVNTFLLNSHIGLVIKHSTARLPPWLFTYDERQMDEIERLRNLCTGFWFAHVCGHDGVMSISYDDFRLLNPVDAETTSFIRVDKGRRTQYRVFGTNGELPCKRSRGVGGIVSAVKAFSI